MRIVLYHDPEERRLCERVLQQAPLAEEQLQARITKTIETGPGRALRYWIAASVMWHVRRNREVAFILMCRAAREGSLVALWDLAEMFFGGIGCKRNVAMGKYLRQRYYEFFERL